MMDFEYLCEQYELGRFQSAVPLKPGTVSQVWRLETDFGPFLVRTLKDKTQGEKEWNIYQHLHARGFTSMPAILVPCFEQDGVWYQVQELVDGTMPDPALPGVAPALAGLAKELSAALSDYSGGPVIHGDLGPWNMLRQDDGTIYVLDFGEAREGDPYFDYASLLGGVINHTPGEQRETVCRDFVRELDRDRSRLLGQLRCWAEQGARSWTGKNEQMAARFINALNWAEEHLYDL